jgi:hypothetical protein
LIRDAADHMNIRMHGAENILSAFVRVFGGNNEEKA